MRVAAFLEGAEFIDGLLAQEAAGRLGGRLAVLGEVKTPARIHHNAVEILQHGGEAAAIRIGHLEIQRQRESVHRMSEQEIIRAMALGHAQVGWQPAPH